MTDELVGAADAATRLGLTSERVRQLAKAGQLPSPLGKVGRQEVWRWRDLRDWAVAQGRLDATAAEGRQTVRAWAPGTARRRRVVEAVLDWDGGRSFVHVRIWEPIADVTEPAVVVLGNLEDSRGSSVTNRIEDVAMLVAARYLGPAGLRAQFYDHWSRSTGEVASFAHVTFSTGPRMPGDPLRGRGGERAMLKALGGALTHPSWRETDVTEIERLVDERVEIYTPGTYTAAMVRLALASAAKPEAIWDPDNALEAALAHEYLSEGALDEPFASLIPTAKRLLAGFAVNARERAASHVGWQSPDAPIQLKVPDFPNPSVLRREAESVDRGVEHAEVWQVASAARQALALRSPLERQLLVPAQGGGLTRLAWWEADTPEPQDDHQGMAGPIVTLSDVLDRAGGADPQDREFRALQAVERAAIQFLREHCCNLDEWEMPQARPAGPYPADGRTAGKYLDSIRWTALPADEEPRLRRLVHLLEGRVPPKRRGRSSSSRTGLDPRGALVVLNESRREFALEWPVGRAALDELGAALLSAMVLADATSRSGAQAVWLGLASGAVMPLPSGTGRGSAHEYTWGYSGTGPTNLRAALLQVLAAAAEHTANWHELERAGERIAALVRDGGTPAWPVALLACAEELA